MKNEKNYLGFLYANIGNFEAFLQNKLERKTFILEV